MLGKSNDGKVPKNKTIFIFWKSFLVSFTKENKNGKKTKMN
jgi:hypothetical protein